MPKNKFLKIISTILFFAAEGHSRIPDDQLLNLINTDCTETAFDFIIDCCRFEGLNRDTPPSKQSHNNHTIWPKLSLPRMTESGLDFRWIHLWRVGQSVLSGDQREVVCRDGHQTYLNIYL